MKQALFIFLSLFSLSISAQEFHYSWGRSLGDTQNDASTDIETDSQGNIVSVGYFKGTIDFNPGPGVAEFISVGDTPSAYVVKMDPDGDFIWAAIIEGNSNAYALTIDDDDNIIMGGNFQGTADCDNGAEDSLITAYAMADAFLVKYNSAGVLQWAYGFGGLHNDEVSALDHDAAGNIYAGGKFNYDVDFDPGLPNITLSADEVSSDLFFLKYAPDGDFQWVKQIRGAATEQLNDLRINSVGDIIIAGEFIGVTDFDPSGEDNSILSLGENMTSDGFVAGYDIYGEINFAEILGGMSNDACEDLAIGENDDIIVVGTFNETADFDPSENESLLTSFGMNDNFIVRLDSQGSYQWARQVGGISFEMARAVAIDDSGHIWVHGVYMGTSDFDPGEGSFNITANGTGFNYDVYLLELDEEGNFASAYSFGSPGTDYANDVCADGQDVYITGYYNDEGLFNTESDSPVFNSAGSFDAYVVKYTKEEESFVVENGGDIFSVYPNPFDDAIFLSFAPGNGVKDVTLRDSEGRQLYSASHFSTSVNINIELSPGIYFIQVESVTGAEVKKLVRK